MPHTDTFDPVVDAQDAQRTPRSPAPTIAVTALASAALSACGGGGGGDPAAASADPEQGLYAQAAAFSANMAELDAHRFLVQATFGPRPGVTDDKSDVKLLQAKGFEQWLTDQFALPRTSLLERTKDNFYKSEIRLGPVSKTTNSPGLDIRHINSAWWEIVLTAEDQLRQRVAFALSEILVISMQSGTLAEWPFMCASYYDLLIDGAFGNYKDLVTKVSAHPAMGLYLSHLGNQKPDATRIPDQNFAREIMQLFTIGLTKLNMDGSEVLSATVPPKPVPTYTPYDVEVLSHVFTGWSFAGSFDGLSPPADNRVDLQTSLMVPFDDRHSRNGQFPRLEGNKIKRFDATVASPVDLTGEIKLLGSTLNIGSPVNAAADRQAALNILFSHPNIAPFIAKQMIQRLVTSNPTKGYVGRAAKAFKDSGLNLKTLVQAILLDTEARDTTTVRNDPAYGKLKEPILRVTQFLRAFKVMSLPKNQEAAAAKQGLWLVSPTEQVSGPGDWVNYLGQSPMRAPTVFNYFRPGYLAPNTEMAKRGKVTPEMQICGESEVAAYVRFMQGCTLKGMGNYTGYFTDPTQPANPIAYSDFTWGVLPNYADEFRLITDTSVSNLDTRVNKVIDQVNVKLFGGAMSEGLKVHLRTTCRDMRDANEQWGYVSLNSSAHRAIASLLLLCTISPEYVTQR